MELSQSLTGRTKSPLPMSANMCDTCVFMRLYRNVLPGSSLQFGKLFIPSLKDSMQMCLSLSEFVKYTCTRCKTKTTGVFHEDSNMKNTLFIILNNLVSLSLCWTYFNGNDRRINRVYLVISFEAASQVQQSSLRFSFYTGDAEAGSSLCNVLRSAIYPQHSIIECILSQIKVVVQHLC